MPTFNRKANATWNGELRTGNGTVSTGSGILKNTPMAFQARFGEEPGTNPEELIAAAHASCYSMALSATLGRKGHPPTRVDVKSTVTLESQAAGGFKVTRSHLEVEAQVPGLDESTFKEIAQEAEKSCPVSNALRAIDITLDAKLAS